VELFEPLDLVSCEELVREVGQRRPAPLCERTAQLIQRFGVVSGLEGGPALGEQPFEAVAVEVVRLERQRVSAGDRPDGVGRQFLA
jgi:hypothetical protein